MARLTVFALALLATAALAGCAREAEPPEPPGAPIADSAAAFPAQPALEDTIRFYVARLRDRSFWSTYGHQDEPRTWYIAAERLGEIGAPAVPHLIGVLGTSDAYEEMLALYALMLAVQDTALRSRTGGEPIGFDTVLSESDNEPNRARALEWWTRHRHVWGR